MRRGIQTGLPRVQELLLLDHQSRFLVRIAALGLSELFLKEHLSLSLVRLMLHCLVCLIVKGLLCESRLLR
jgi:hypothetical protein